MAYGVRLRIWGERACFTRPEMKVERVSYDALTPSAARGILEALGLHRVGEVELNHVPVDFLKQDFQRSSPSLLAQKEAFEMAQREFSKVVDTTDEAQLLAYLGAVESARSELNKSRMLMLSRMRRVLTPDQRARLDVLRQQRTQTSSSGSSHRR